MWKHIEELSIENLRELSKKWSLKNETWNEFGSKLDPYFCSGQSNDLGQLSQRRRSPPSLQIAQLSLLVLIFSLFIFWFRREGDLLLDDLVLSSLEDIEGWLDDSIAPFDDDMSKLLY